MKIVMGFSGGNMDDAALLYDSTALTEEGEAVQRFVVLTKNAEIGRRFAVPNGDGFEIYEIVQRFENGQNLILRAMHVTHRLTVAELAGISPTVSRHK
jgi:hypothetical protein